MILATGSFVCRLPLMPARASDAHAARLDDLALRPPPCSPQSPKSPGAERSALEALRHYARALLHGAMRAPVAPYAEMMAG